VLIQRRVWGVSRPGGTFASGLSLAPESGIPNPRRFAVRIRSGMPVIEMAAAESDANLIERIGQGDRDAFDELYRRFARPVLAMAMRQLGDNGRAEDAAQETFAAVWRSAKSFRSERGTGSAWLYAVARHAIVDRARQRRDPLAEAPDEPSPDAGPAERAEASWLTWKVHSALEKLPERERVVLELAYWSGLSQTEIASYLDVPLGTVKTRTRTGLSRLTTDLEEVRK